MNGLIKFSGWVGHNFLWLALAFAALGFFAPATLIWAMGYLNFILALIMFGMGLTMTGKDFEILGRQPRAVCIGVCLQFFIMPSLAWALSKLLQLPHDIAIGVILVGACPGGTASNVISYLAKGNLALSVAVTSLSTLLAPLLTPAIFYLLAHRQLQFSATDMFWNIVNIVLLPVVLGIAAHRFFKKQVERCYPLLPLVSVFGIALLIGAIFGSNRAKILDTGPLIFLVVVLHNGLGLLLGFWLARWLKLPYADQKTLAIEVGMQNSGLAVTLAKNIFSTLPLATVPGAIFSLWHNLSGALLASYWARRAEVNHEA